MREAHTKHAVRFQYKICYSKILFLLSVHLVLILFQYKICYSKIFFIHRTVINKSIFQYKICYSKIIMGADEYSDYL